MIREWDNEDEVSLCKSLYLFSSTAENDKKRVESKMVQTT